MNTKTTNQPKESTQIERLKARFEQKKTERIHREERAIEENNFWHD
jgi:hypothetical protein